MLHSEHGGFMTTYIRGVGMTKFDVGRRGTYERVRECVNEAIESAGMEFNEVDTIFTSNSESGRSEDRQKHQGPLLSTLFQREMPILNIHGGCAGGGIALWNSISHLNSSNCRNIMVVGYDNIVSLTTEVLTDEILMGGERIYEQSEGLIFPAQNALVAQQYMIKYGATSEDLALVALKNHENAFNNPKAHFFGKKVTLDMIRKSPIVASPLRLFDCSISVDGAAAVIISRKRSDIEITASSLYASRLSAFESRDMTTWESTVMATKEAYKEAAITASDVDFVELHDAFTPVELMSYEDLGFCSKGKGKKLIREGATKINGKLPVNASGGLKAKGHPVSATGISQIYEIVRQMRRRCGNRQIGRTSIGLAHNVGGAGSTATVHILKSIGG